MTHAGRISAILTGKHLEIVQLSEEEISKEKRRSSPASKSWPLRTSPKNALALPLRSALSPPLKNLLHFFAALLIITPALAQTPDTTRIELPDQRTYWSKTYYNAKDNTYTTTISAGYIHYQASDGTDKDIDTLGRRSFKKKEWMSVYRAFSKFVPADELDEFSPVKGGQIALGQLKGSDVMINGLL